MLPENYQKHLVTQLNKMQYLMVSILVQLLQSYRWVRLEELSNKFPSPILLASRRRKPQRFLDLPILTLEALWLPIILKYIRTHQGNSDAATQEEILSRILPSLKDYKKVVLGDREFCSVDLAKWLKSQSKTYFCLRLKKNEYLDEALKSYQKRWGIEEMFRDFKSGGYNLEDISTHR